MRECTDCKAIKTDKWFRNKEEDGSRCGRCHRKKYRHEKRAARGTAKKTSAIPCIHCARIESCHWYGISPNKVCSACYNNERREKNPEPYKESNRRHHRTEKRKQANKKVAQRLQEEGYFRRWGNAAYKKDPQKFLNRMKKAKNRPHYQAMRKWERKRATPPGTDRKELARIYRERPPGMDTDHIVPIANKDVCGLHVPYNLQYLSPEDNRRIKKNSFDGTYDNEGWRNKKKKPGT